MYTERKTYEELEERDHANQTEEMRSTSHDGSESSPTLHHGAQEQRDEEQSQQNRCVPHNWTNSDHSNPDQGGGILLAILVRE